MDLGIIPCLLSWVVLCLAIWMDEILVGGGGYLLSSIVSIRLGGVGDGRSSSRYSGEK